MDALLTAEGLIALLSLTLMEIVLGIDNIIFISILSDRLPEEQQKLARRIGISLALIVRIVLLSMLTWLIGLSEPIFTAFGMGFSWRDLIMIAGGLFLIYNSVTEIHEKVEGLEHDEKQGKLKVSLATAVFQIIMLDVVFSFDSILTAIGLSDQLIIMVVAVVISMIVMLAMAEKIAAFINNHPTVKVLALSFLLMIGFMLMVDGFHVHIPKGYIYFSIFFALFVETLNFRMRKKPS